ncbi:MAG: putative manganese-dependent inorganic diphosphatase [Clostridiales bacterium]|nr:putative manganese-dependent inorganic diphosphatase [Clostridiales bacterium]
MKVEREIYVIGHINPDTDTICSAIAYANLKNIIDDKKYVPKRAGTLNSETRFVLDYFDIKEPDYLDNVYTQVKDMEIRRIDGISKDISLKEAWTIMERENIVTLPVLSNGRTLEGLITVDDITKINMDIFDSRLIGTSNTSFKNIVDTLEGELVIGDLNEYLEGGKILIAAANPELMENYIDEGDVVIVGNRYESQLSAIEMNAKCIIISDGADVAKSIKSIATKAGCTIIRTPYDTFTVARVINQSMPVGHFMRQNNLVTFNLEDELNEARATMAKVRFRYFPILDDEGKYVGMVSNRNLIGAKQKQVILVDHNEKTQAVEGIEEADILEIIDHHRIGSLETLNPIFFRNQPLGCTSTIIYLMYKEYRIDIEKDIAGILCSAILSDTLIFKSPTCTRVDIDAANELAKIAKIDIFKYDKKMFSAGSDLKKQGPDKILHQDFKTFNLGKTRVGVGQINSMDKEGLASIKKKLIPYGEEYRRKDNFDMIYFLLTDILDSSSELLAWGEGAEEIARKAFDLNEEEALYLPGIVSRKKQFIPGIMRALQQEL